MEKKCIICVDDEKIVLDGLRVQLNRHFGKQFFYEFAESGEEALEILEELEISDFNILVIISDWLMPNMKGDEFLLKVHAKYPKIQMLMLTGQADDSAINDLIKKIENLKVIYKPWKENQLVDEIILGLK
jgi:CheY-like chemotaxis protein